MQVFPLTYTENNFNSGITDFFDVSIPVLLSAKLPSKDRFLQYDHLLILHTSKGH